ncbi:MAG: phospholipid carrier-dependent glycosyltransferase [Chloroflexi bacterium]|nr:phospholipid carrier-dependent glycosyltransferase [Chloroflexota bacterium]
MTNDQLTTRPPDHPTTRLSNYVTKTLYALAILAFVSYFIIYCLYAFSLFRFPYDYDQGEGFELNDSLLLSQGQWPYRDNEVYPFYASNYPPLFHLLVIPLFSIFGQTLLAGRVLAFALSLILAALAGWVVHAQTRDRPIAVLSGLMVLASNFIYHVGPLFRQHLPMVLFELLAVIAMSKYDDAKHSKRNILLSMLALLAAGYTKQLAVTTVAAVLIFLFLRSPKKSIVAGVGLAVVAGAIFLWMNIATQGQWFLNAITANANAYDVHQALDLFRQFFSLHFVIAAFAVGYSVYELYWSRLSVFTIWFTLALIASALAGKWGAGESYFSTAIVAACVVSGLALAKIKQTLPVWQPRLAPIVLATIPLLYLLQAYGVRHLPTDGPIFGAIADLIGVGGNASVYEGYPYYDAIGYTQVGHFPTEADAAAGDRIVDTIKLTHKPALTEEALLALRADQPVVTNPTQLLNLWNNRAFDPTDLIAMIDRQAFGLVVFRAQFYPPPVLQAIGARYEPLTEITMNGFPYRLLVPRKDYGAGCDEARFYGSIAKLKSLLPEGVSVRIADRDSRPTNWTGPKGVSELEFVAGSRGVIDRVWIGPLTWVGTPPADGNGATRLGQNQCFQFFDLITDVDGVWPNARAAIVESLGIMP